MSFIGGNAITFSFAEVEDGTYMYRYLVSVCALDDVEPTYGYTVVPDV